MYQRIRAPAVTTPAGMVALYRYSPAQHSKLHSMNALDDVVPVTEVPFPLPTAQKL